MKKSIFLLHDPNSGQSWQRVWLSYKNCVHDLATEGIRLAIGTEAELAPGYDAYVVNRQPPPGLLPFLNGKKFIWHIDDNLWAIPTWNPAYRAFSPDICNWMLEHAADMWVSTHVLKDVIGRGQVLPNLLDTSYWPPVAPRRKNDQIRIVWAGSCFHEPDMELVVGVFEKLLVRYKDANILCVFFGCHPDSMGKWVRVPGTSTAILFPHDHYNNKVGFAMPVKIEVFPKGLNELNPDIGIAALEDSPFARSKSNLKWLEYSMIGTPTVASPLPPYADTISLQKDLYEDCCELIENEEKRTKLGADAQAAVQQHWTWDTYKKDWWMEAFRKAVA